VETAQAAIQQAIDALPWTGDPVPAATIQGRLTLILYFGPRLAQRGREPPDLSLGVLGAVFADPV